MDFPTFANVGNAHILSKKIEGDRAADQYKGDLWGLGYRDFADPGNVIRDSEGIGWVVDTEVKSFDPPHVKNRDPVALDLSNKYLKKRFEILAGTDYDFSGQIFRISVADLNLK